MSSTIPPDKTSKPPAPGTPAGTARDAELVEVRVFHNLTAAEQGRYPCEYMPGDRAVQVFATPAPRTAGHLAVCEAIWRLLNVGDDPAFTVTPDPRAVAYRNRGNRAMSTGDLVCIGSGTWYAAARAGFTPVTAVPLLVTEQQPGTAPYEGTDLP